MSKKLNKGSAGQNRKAGQGFMEKYRLKDGVQESPSGLLFRVLEESDGMRPTEQDVVVVNQRILNADGSVIADTYKAGIPDTFTMKEAIPGLREGLLLMPVGARYELVIPPELAWGRRGATNKIGPNAVLIIDVRLLEIKF
ncbi:FKBP-type peptidyl-prolyl cis-trans isomerase [Teredinibacter turnerae]|uniref:FKBP-type peptidyl-prolyl cis-trans isomerase n=1 Tax=Teredinibacter turnerae TaxID=2426 RepID=UPI000364F3BE|nr:FKBP-type peptidyl-prolyl cis-trans isomerase [Teredinibacter turnerae]